MKSNCKFFLLTLALGLFVSTSVFAQSNPTATFSSDSGIVLSSTHPLGDTYDMDISGQGWTREVANSALVYLDEQSELIGLELDFVNKKFILTLDLDAREAKNWNIEKWSELLASIK